MLQSSSWVSRSKCWANTSMDRLAPKSMRPWTKTTPSTSRVMVNNRPRSGATCKTSSKANSVRRGGERKQAVADKGRQDKAGQKQWITSQMRDNPADWPALIIAVFAGNGKFAFEYKLLLKKELRELRELEGTGEVLFRRSNELF